MGIRAAVVEVGSGRDGPSLDNLICEKVPILLWGEYVDVERALDIHDMDAAGSRVVRLKLYLRLRVPGLEAGLRFREEAIAILGDAGTLQHQVRFPPSAGVTRVVRIPSPYPAAAGSVFFFFVPAPPMRMHAPLSRGSGRPPGSFAPAPPSDLVPSPPQFLIFVLVWEEQTDGAVSLQLVDWFWRRVVTDRKSVV